MQRNTPEQRSPPEMFINAKNFHVSFRSWARDTIHQERLPINKVDRKRLELISNYFVCIIFPLYF